jgi:predicted RNase H-like HicB family nuclease
MAEVTYTVNVTREGDAWIADIPQLPGAHTFARNLTALYQSVKEVIALVAELPDEPGENSIEYEFEGIDEELALAVALGRQRADHEALQQQLSVEAADRIARLTSKGYSVRDISAALRMSPGRVSQIATSSKAS